MASPRPRVALIGLGGVGALHLAAYRQLNGIEIVAAAEPVASRREALLGGSGIAGFPDHRSMLDACHPDLACVLTPPLSHGEIVLDCAAAGVHVLCEKPIALSLESVDRMREACRAAGVRLYYGASYRHLPAIWKARELILQGAIGRVQFMREEVLGGTGAAGWHALPDHHYPHGGPGGSGMGLMDHGVHLIDVFRWFTGQEVTRVTGRGNRTGAAPRTELLCMDFEGGATALLAYNDATFPVNLPGAGLFAEGSGWDSTGYVGAGSWATNPCSIEVYGSEGSLRIFHYANALFRFDGAGVQRIPLTGAPSPAHFGTQLEAVVANLRSGEGSLADAEDGRRALAVALAAYASESEGRTVAPYLT